MLAFRAAWRAIERSDPGRLTPSTISSTRSGATPASANAAFAACEASSGMVSGVSAPPNFPNGVRFAPRIATSDTALPPLPLGADQLALQDLPGRPLRQVVDEFDVAGLLVAGQALAAERHDRVLVELGALAGDDERFHRLAPTVVGDADDGDLADRRMLGDHALDLGRVDVQPAADDHVAGPVDDVEKA